MLAMDPRRYRLNSRRIQFAQVLISFTKPDGSEFSKYAQWDFVAYPSDGCAPRTVVHAGDLAVDYCSNQVVFDVEDAAGVWSVNNVVLTDSLGNSRTYYRDELESMQLAKTVEISGGATDFTPPELSDLTVRRHEP